jgi:hypothetical protein
MSAPYEFRGGKLFVGGKVLERHRWKPDGVEAIRAAPECACVAAQIVRELIDRDKRKQLKKDLKARRRRDLAEWESEVSEAA